MIFPDNGWARKTGVANASPHRSDSYYFYYNDVLIIMLNTVATQNATAAAQPNHTAQANWLRGVLEKDRDEGLSKYVIVGTHISPLGGRNSDRSMQPGVREAYIRLITEFNVDIFFAGHDHVYTRSNPIKITGTNLDLSAMYNNGDFDSVDNGTIFSIASATGPKFYTVDPSDTHIPRYYPIRVSGEISEHSPGVFINIKVTQEKLAVTAMRLHLPPPGSPTPLVEIDSYEVPVKTKN